MKKFLFVLLALVAVLFTGCAEKVGNAATGFEVTFFVVLAIWGVLALSDLVLFLILKSPRQKAKLGSKKIENIKSAKKMLDWFVFNVFKLIQVVFRRIFPKEKK